MAIAFVQSGNARATGATSKAFTSNNTGANLIVVGIVLESNTDTIASVADTRGNTYALAGVLQGSGSAGYQIAIYYAKNIATGANTVTVTPTTGTTQVDIAIHEYSGAHTTAPLDVTSSATGTSAAANSGSATTTAAGDLIFGLINSNAAVAIDGTLTARETFTFNYFSYTADKIGASAGSYAVNGTLTSNAWGAAMATFKPAGTTKVYYAQSPIADTATYYGGFKEGRILKIGPIRRALSGLNGDFSTASVTITLDDSDRALRTLDATGTLMNRRVDVFAVDDADRRAGTPARRLGSFVIRRWKADGELTFTLELEDWFGSQLGEFNLGKQIPANTFTKATFSGLPDALVNVPEPIIYGAITDESNGSDAAGAVPCYYTGQETVSSFLWDRYVVCGHAIKSIQSWFASDLGDNPTGQPRRIKMPAGTEGVDFLIPGNAGWNAATGSSNKYRTFGGRRYTVIYARGPRSDAAKSGGVPITLNVCGVEDVGDGSGTMIDGLPSQIQHVLTNHVLQTYQTGSWLTVPLLNTYSKLANLTTVNTIAGARISGGYKGAFILGGSLGQISVADFMKQASQSCDVQFGVNRAGQLAMSMENPSGSAVATFTDVMDIDDGGLGLEIGWDELANKVPYRYGRSYTPPAGKDDPAIPWLVDTSLLDGAAITAHLQTKLAPTLELTLVRDTLTGDDVVARVLTRRTGGSAPYRGPVYATVRGGLNLAGVDLGDIVSVTHFAGLGSGGWTAQKARVMAIDLDPETWGIALRAMKL